MTVRNPGRPTSAEQIAYFRQYIDLVPDGDIIDILTRQIVETTAFFSSFTLEQAQWRPEAGEWSTVEIAGHVADTERVLTYRALSIA
ncbi:MAG: DinB family protein, partial [Chloroflexota bacterium]|nr:DinB family protein [Chloroflexota bacterium]